MSSIATKKYVRAILDSFKGKDLDLVESIFSKLSSLFNNHKFSTIILSPTIDIATKEELVLSIVETDNKNIKNLISLLAENKRLELIPSIEKELKFQIAKLNNVYTGKIISNADVSNEQISILEKKLSDKFGANIKLEAEKSDYSGVKIELNDLGIETSFSLDRLRAQITEHILKAI